MSLPSYSTTRSEKGDDQIHYTRCQRARRYVFNKEKKTVCGKRLKNWAFIFAFYIIFGTFCAGVFYLETADVTNRVEQGQKLWYDPDTI